MDKLANEDHTHTTSLQKKLVFSVAIGGYIRSNFVGSDTMLVRHRAPFKEALFILRHFKSQEDQAYYQNWWQSSSSSWWNWQDSWWHSSSEYHATMDPAPIDRGNLIDGDWANFLGNDSQN